MTLRGLLLCGLLGAAATVAAQPAAAPGAAPGEEAAPQKKQDAGPAPAATVEEILDLRETTAIGGYILGGYTYSTDGDPSDGDYNDDGAVDALDYLGWAGDFGTHVATSVPEPAGAASVALCLPLLLGARRRK